MQPETKTTEQLQAELDQVKRELARTTLERDRLAADLAAARQTGDGLAPAPDELEARLAERIEALEGENRRIESRVDARTRELQEANEALANQQDELLAAITELANQRRFAETLLERLPAGVAYLDRDFVFRVANPILARFYGKPLKEVLNRHVYDVLPGAAKDVEAVYAQVRETLEPVFVNSHPVSYELNGREHHTYWDASILPYLDASGAFDGWLALASEVSERVHTESALRRQTELTERIIGTAPVGISFLNRDLIYESVNLKQAEVFGIPVEAIVGRSVYDVLGPETEAQLGGLFASVLAGEPYFGLAFPFKLTFDGQEKQTYWDFTYQPSRNDQGEIEGVLILAQEVSERVEKETLQAEKIAVLEETDKLKDKFLSILSHELRTPINAIMGFGSVLDDEIAGPLNDRQHAYMGRILASSDALLTLIDDLLVMSRVQAGQFSIHPEPTDMLEVVTTVIEACAPAAATKRITVVCDVAAEWPRLHADAVRIGQVFSNLVGNALKFTPAGGTVTVRASAARGVLRCEVSDDGIGIAPADHGKLFTRFGQVDISNTRANTGTGLGLSIVKAIVEAHGGQVGLESALGQGSTFWFTLPLDAERV